MFSPTKINFILSNCPEISALNQRLSLNLKISEILKKILPNYLKKEVTVSNYEKGTLTLIANGPLVYTRCVLIKEGIKEKINERMNECFTKKIKIVVRRS